MNAKIAATLMLLPTTLSAANHGGYSHGPHMWSGGGWHGWLAGPVMMVASIAIAIAVVVLMIRWLGGLGHGSAHPYAPPGKTPIDILKERYARGEIDKEEFEERRRVLES